MPTISSGTAEASNNYNKVDNVPAAASASTSNYTSCAASDIPKDAATPPSIPPKYCSWRTSTKCAPAGRGSRREEPTSVLTERGSWGEGHDSEGHASGVYSNCDRGGGTATHTVATNSSTPQRCNLTPAMAATAVEIPPAIDAHHFRRSLRFYQR